MRICCAHGLQDFLLPRCQLIFFFFFKDGQEIQGGKDGHLDKWGSEHLNSHMRKEPKPISHYYKY